MRLQPHPTYNQNGERVICNTQRNYLRDIVNQMDLERKEELLDILLTDPAHQYDLIACVSNMLNDSIPGYDASLFADCARCGERLKLYAEEADDIRRLEQDAELFCDACAQNT